MIDKLNDGVLRVLTPLGPRYIRPSFKQRLYLLWVFRNFQVLPMQVLSGTMLQDHLEALLRTLSDREQRIIHMRFGMTDGYPRTLEEVGQEFGVTRERIRQIETKTLAKLRQPCRALQLRDFLD